MQYRSGHDLPYSVRSRGWTLTILVMIEYQKRSFYFLALVYVYSRVSNFSVMLYVKDLSCIVQFRPFKILLLHTVDRDWWIWRPIISLNIRLRNLAYCFLPISERSIPHFLTFFLQIAHFIFLFFVFDAIQNSIADNIKNGRERGHSATRLR